MVGTSTKVVIIDADLGVRRTLSAVLESEGYEVLTAADGDSGLELAERHAPAFVLCDSQAPKLDGLQFLKRVRSIQAAIVRDRDGALRGQRPRRGSHIQGSLRLLAETLHRGRAASSPPKSRTAREVLQGKV